MAVTGDESGRTAGCWLAALVVIAVLGGAILPVPATAQTNGTTQADETTTPNGTARANGTATPNGTTQANGTIQANGTTTPNGTAGSTVGMISGGDTLGSASFNQSTITENRGDIAAIEVNLTGASRATVTVGSQAINYETNVTVVDGNDDGRVVLLLNTYIAGTGPNETGVYGTLAEADNVTRVNRTTGRLGAPLDTSTYNLSVAVGGRRTDTATLRLTGRSTDGLVTWTAPAASFDNVTNASAVAVAVETGRITTTDTVAAGDVLVLQTKISGVYGALEAANFTELTERGVFDLTIVQTNPGTNRKPKRLDLDRSLANGSIRVIPDPENDVLYINIDTGAAVFDHGAPAPGDEFVVTFTLSKQSSLAGSTQSVSARVTVVGAELGLGDVSLAAADNQVVAGTTSVAPGSEVTVRLKANGTGSFVKTNTTTVTPNGTFVAGFNLSAIAPNTTVSVRAVGPLNTSDELTVTVRPSRESDAPDGTARLTVSDQTTTGETVTIRAVTLPDGGYVVVHAPNVSSAPVASVLGASTYLESGTTENVTVTLTHPLTESTEVVVMAHRDTNDNRVYDFSSTNGSEDVPYTTLPAGVATAAETGTTATGATTQNTTAGTTSAGEPVATSVYVTVKNATATMMGIGTAATGTDAAGGGAGGGDGTGDSGGGDADTGGGGGETGGTTTENGTGFGVALAAVALVLAAVLALRRR